MRIIDKFFREDQAAEIAKGRLAWMLIIDMFFQRRMVLLPVTTSYITRDVRAEISNDRLAMLQIIEKFFLEDRGGKIGKADWQGCRSSGCFSRGTGFCCR